jgi:F-type H+-transporting ATPase subunit delta
MGRFRAQPYAKALFQVIQDQAPDRAEDVADELDRVATALTEVPEFQKVLVTPMVSVENKTAILDQVLDTLEIKEPVRRFLHVVQQHYRMEHMSDIASTYRELVDESLGRTRARVETAEGLDGNVRQRVVEAIAGVEGGTVVADFSTRPELLGGFKLQVGSRVFDGSLAGELNRLSKEIVIEQG